MSKLFNVAKVSGFVALLALILVSAVPVTGHAAAAKAVASDAEAAAVARDCDATDNVCFVRVNDDGSITVYKLGKLLS